MSEAGDKRADAQFQYAWQWFSYHATQRTNMLNYFLVGIGILANAYVAAVTAKLTTIALAIAILGTIVSLCFTMLDVRNQTLVGYAQDVLRKCERNYLFAGDGDYAERGSGILLTDDARESREPILTAILSGRHKVFIPLIEITSALAFAGAAVWTAFAR
jgi:hypothetical protein